MDEPVLIVPYDPQWPILYEHERESIAGAMRDAILGIEHFGSTAVPGMPSKPVIDILVLVAQLDPVAAYAGPLKLLGYEYLDLQDLPAEHIFLHKGSPRTHHLHIVPRGSHEHRRHIAFRDYLRTHPETAREYAELKLALAVKFCYERENYTNAKTDFIRAIEAQAGVTLP